MAADLFYLPFRPVIDANGLPVAGAKLYFYATGTTTPQAIYSTSALSTQLTNPVEANAAGVFPNIYLNDALDYRLVIKDAAGATLYDLDPYIAGVAGEKGDTGDTGPTGTVSGASTFVVDTTQPATPSNGTSQALLEFTTPTNPTGQPSPAIMRITTTHNPYSANEQGITHPAYTNKTVGLTVGYTTVYGKQISTEAGAAMIIEHGFHVTSNRPGGGTVKGCEWHWQMTGADWEGYRPITAYGPWTGADKTYDASISFQGAFLDMKDGAGNSIISWNFRGALSDAKVVSLNSALQFQHAGNGYPWLKQLNAAGNAQLNMPYVNSSNGYTFDRDVYMSVGTPATNPLGIQSLLTLTGSGIATGARLCYLGGNSVTGTVTCFEADQSASTASINVLRNTHASGEARSVIETSGTGNAVLRFTYNSSSLNVSANLTWNGTTVAFDKAPKLPSFTVAGLPSASTAGAGAMAWCSNLSGGAGPVMSNGTDWKVIALGATASA